VAGPGVETVPGKLQALSRIAKQDSAKPRLVRTEWVDIFILLFAASIITEFVRSYFPPHCRSHGAPLCRKSPLCYPGEERFSRCSDLYDGQSQGIFFTRNTPHNHPYLCKKSPRQCSAAIF
jgi:hypothetical protein